jgi:hypothetical protein
MLPHLSRLVFHILYYPTLYNVHSCKSRWKINKPSVKQSVMFTETSLVMKIYRNINSVHADRSQIWPGFFIRWKIATACYIGSFKTIWMSDILLLASFHGKCQTLYTTFFCRKSILQNFLILIYCSSIPPLSRIPSTIRELRHFIHRLSF